MNKETTVKYAIKTPLITYEEIRVLDNNFRSIVNEVIEAQCKEKELALLQLIIKKQQQALLDIREYAIKEKEFNDNQINEYKTCIETNLNGKFNKEEKENMEHSMTVNICINYKMNDILQIIDKVLGCSDENN